MTAPNSPTIAIAIAGASGFVGQALLDRFADDFSMVALSRRVREDDPRCEWRACDLYSLLDTEQALAGCDVAVYLVHSMLPSARLTQASFEDLDLVLADNFARGAKRAGVRRIVYLAGLVPDDARLSKHLESRREVERALGAHGVPVTVLRAGMVVGARGSSFQMLTRLVERLPAMALPAWTRTRTQPIALEDVIELLGIAAREGTADDESKIHDIGGPDVLTYRQMLEDVAEVQGRTRTMLNVPFFSPGLSRLWVSLITGFPRALVGPLVESLEHEMVARDRSFQLAHGIDGTDWKTALIAAEKQRAALDRPVQRKKPKRPPLVRRTPGYNVRSVQRLPSPAWMNAVDVGHEYLRWLPRFFWPFMRVDVRGDTACFFFWPARRALLEIRLSEDRSSTDRALFYVDGGLLAVLPTDDERRGRLEFRLAPGGQQVIAALHDFVPSLPWAVYVRTQARVHLFVMHAFGRHLRRVRVRGALPPGAPERQGGQREPSAALPQSTATDQAG